jgi:hypothetical protein
MHRLVAVVVLAVLVTTAEVTVAYLQEQSHKVVLANSRLLLDQRFITLVGVPDLIKVLAVVV